MFAESFLPVPGACAVDTDCVTLAQCCCCSPTHLGGPMS